MKNFSTITIRLFSLVLIVLIICPFLSFAESAPDPNPQIIINEIGAKETADYEWIEIYNKSSAGVDLTGWKFYEEQTNHGLTAFRGDFVIEPDEYAIIANKAESLAPKYSDYTGTILDSSWGSLKEDGEEIGLKDTSGNFVELFTYPALIGNGISLERLDKNTQAAEPTNWASNPTAHSLGKPNENSLISTQDETTNGTTSNANTETVSGTTTTETTGTTTDTTGTTTETQTEEPESTSQPQQQTPPPPQIIVSAPQILPPKAIIQVQSGLLIAENITTVNFDGRASFDPNGDLLTFLWDMGDSTKESTANPSPHKYGKPGTYVVTLTVTNSHGLQDKAEQNVQVINKPTTSTVQTEQPDEKPETQKVAPLPSGNVACEITGTLVLNPTNSAEQAFSLQLKKFKTTVNLDSATLAKATVKNPTATAKATKKSTSSPSKKTSYSNGDLSDSIRITEIFPAPDSSDTQGEWIEIFNEDTIPINLGNWMLANSKKVNNPYLIPDAITIDPGEYIVFPKTDTKITLNNKQDSVFLADYDGDIIDSVSYKETQKAKSYALINITESQPRVAGNLTASALSIQQSNSAAWEWVEESSPGKPNPSFEMIKGTVEQLLLDDTSIKVATADGTSKKIKFAEADLDPRVADVVMSEGANVTVQAEQASDGTYTLKKIDSVQPSNKAEEKSGIPWIVVGMLIVGIALNAPPVFAVIKNYLKKKKIAST